MQTYRRGMGNVVGIGILMVIFGCIALFLPFVTTVTLSVLLGSVLLAAGIVEVIDGVRYFSRPGTVSQILLGILSVVAGVIVWRAPLAGMIGITLMMTFFFFMSAASKWMLASEIRPMKGWGWLFVSSTISFFLAVIMIANLQTISLVAPGIFLGIDLITYGIACIAISIHARKVSGQLEKEERELEERRRRAA